MEFNLVSRMKLSQSSPAFFTLTEVGTPTQELWILRRLNWVWLAQAETQQSHSKSPETICEHLPVHLS